MPLGNTPFEDRQQHVVPQQPTARGWGGRVGQALALVKAAPLRRLAVAGQPLERIDRHQRLAIGLIPTILDEWAALGSRQEPKVHVEQIVGQAVGGYGLRDLLDASSMPE